LKSFLINPGHNFAVMWRFLLYPLSVLYGFGVSIRNLLFDFKILTTHHFNIPVISVGNITVGGTGKTPHVEYLIQLLKEKYKVSVLSRGYKRKSKGHIISGERPNTNDIGDEPAQIKFKFPDVEVAVNANRVEGIDILEARKNDLVILDDAFQHRYVKPGLSILLIDFNRRIDKAFLLPFGNLREKANEIRRADIIIVTKTPHDIKPIDRRLIMEQVKPFPFQELYFTSFKYGQLEPVFVEKLQLPDDFDSSHEIYSILAVTGIAYSDPFIEYLKGFSLDICHIELADHSAYNANKLNKIVNTYNSIKNDKKIILTTEKDAIKLREIDQVDDILVQNMFFIPIEVSFIDNENEFNNQIFDYVKKNHRNYKVYPEANIT
jgi:tetraacyldisaccharide 4'-kinase